MNQDKIAYFVAKFSAYDTDELEEVVARRDSLADEAIEALDRVLASKGLENSAAIKAAHQSSPAEQVAATASIEEKTIASRELWRGWLSNVCTAMVMLTFFAPLQNFVRANRIGAFWVLLLSLAIGYFGLKVGKSITKGICANSERSIADKRKRLWLLFFALFPIYMVVFVITNALFGR